MSATFRLFPYLVLLFAFGACDSPKEIQGPTGAKGPTGAQGPTGVQGVQGVQGQTGLQGPTGPPSNPLLWLVDGTGSAIGPVVPSGLLNLYSAPGPSYSIQIWDQADGMAVSYTLSNGSYSLSRNQGVHPYEGALIYATADCSDSPHFDPGIPQNILFVFGSIPSGTTPVLYKVSSVTDNIVPVSYRGDTVTQGQPAVGPCQGIQWPYPTGLRAFSRAQQIQTLGVPTTLQGPVQFLWQ